jgi:hypothetical protein
VSRRPHPEPKPATHPNRSVHHFLREGEARKNRGCFGQGQVRIDLRGSAGICPHLDFNSAVCKEPTSSKRSKMKPRRSSRSDSTRSNARERTVHVHDIRLPSAHCGWLTRSEPQLFGLLGRGQEPPQLLPPPPSPPTPPAAGQNLELLQPWASTSHPASQ